MRRVLYLVLVLFLGVTSVLLSACTPSGVRADGTDEFFLDSKPVQPKTAEQRLNDWINSDH